MHCSVYNLLYSINARKHIRICNIYITYTQKRAYKRHRFHSSLKSDGKFRLKLFQPENQLCLHRYTVRVTCTNLTGNTQCMQSAINGNAELAELV